jgi:DNA-binding beta-propeller fold protein YncE
MQRSVVATITVLFVTVAGWKVAGFGAAATAPQATQNRSATGAVPAFQVDPLWPKPLPNHWILGSVTGVAVDSRDHVWIVHRGADSLNARTEMGLGTEPPSAEGCCAAAPPVLEFDADGNLVSHWGGPGQGYDWPMTPGGIAVDAKGNVWITAAGWPEPPAARGGGAGRGRAAGAAGAAGAGAAAPAAPPPPPARPFDAHILKFSATGQFLQQLGKPGASEGSAGKATFNRPAGLAFDASANEIYVADGYTNRRVVVLDATTGAYKRHWGAYGAAPDDATLPAYDPAAPPAKQFRTVGCVELSRDGQVYVCDRQNNRIQVFRKDGTFVKEVVVSKGTLGNGSVWDIAFSSDTEQRYLFAADGQDHTVAVLVRATLTQTGTLGSGGRWPGAFYAVGSVAVDSRGNLYTGETLEGKRVQKFAPKR